MHRHDADDDDAGVEDHRLAEVEEAERGPDADGRALVVRHRRVEALGLHLLVGEVLHRLEVEQAVDRLGVGVGVALVHVAADRDAPVRGLDGEPEVEPDGDDQDAEVADAEHDDEDRCRR